MKSSISRRTFLCGAVGMAAVAIQQRLPAAAAPLATPAPRPNLLFIFPDEFRQAALGCMHADPVLTPNLDRLASQGLVLTHAVSNYPLCSPYRGMLFTGKYPCANHVTDNCYTHQPDVFLRSGERCLSDALHDSGYACGYIGKWHLETPHEPYLEKPRGAQGEGGVWDEYTPPQRRHGFDFWHSYGCWDNHFQPHYWIGDAPRDGMTRFDQWSPEHDADTAIAYLQNRDGRCRDAAKPFALFVAMNPPHMPFAMAPDKYKALYAGKTPRDLLVRPNVNLDATDAKTGEAVAQVANYFALVSGVDDQIGRILDCLKAQGLEQNTLVVFTSDHGEMMGSHARMQKLVWYDESLLVPFLVRWPGQVRCGRDDLLLSVPDLFPTLLGMMGLAPQAPPGLQGRDWSAALLGLGGSRPDSALYCNHNANLRGVRTHRHTLMMPASGNNCQLYDNETDPYQMTNLAAANPALLKELRGVTRQWLQQIGDPWTGATG